jgi:CRP/FNR family transcriptional regulator, anaerobic regulatory protein
VLEGGAATSVIAASDMVLCRFHKAKLPQLFQQSPPRAYDLVWIAAAEEHFLSEIIATLGQRSASERMAWATLKIYARLREVGLARDGTVVFPFTQRDLADALGLSLVHTNKTLAKLRPYMTWEKGLLRIIDEASLAKIAMTAPEPPKNRPLL